MQFKERPGSRDLSGAIEPPVKIKPPTFTKKDFKVAAEFLGIPDYMLDQMGKQNASDYFIQKDNVRRGFE